MHKSYFFKKSGYSVISVFNKNEINDISTIIEKRLNLITRKKMFSNNIRKLHKIEIDDNSYKEIIKSETRYINIGKKKIRKIEKNTELTNILNSFWNHSKIKVIWVGDPKKRELKTNMIGFRIARPSKKDDAAKEHIDMYNNDFKSFVSLWIPIIGFGKKYTVKLFPGTHTINHKKNSFQRNRKVISRIFKKSYINKFPNIRLRLKHGHGILFHPNMIHGASDNMGKKARVSIEFRIFNRKRFNINKSFSLI